MTCLRLRGPGLIIRSGLRLDLPLQIGILFLQLLDLHLQIFHLLTGADAHCNISDLATGAFGSRSTNRWQRFHPEYGTRASEYNDQ